MEKWWEIFFFFQITLIESENDEIFEKVCNLLICCRIWNRGKIIKYISRLLSSLVSSLVLNAKFPILCEPVFCELNSDSINSLENFEFSVVDFNSVFFLVFLHSRLFVVNKNTKKYSRLWNGENRTEFKFNCRTEGKAFRNAATL